MFSLACHGLKQWKKIFLIPWLSFYLLVLGIVTTCLLQALYSHNFLLQWRHIFLFFAIFTIFYCWSHVKKQYLMMMLPRPEQANNEIINECLQTIMASVQVTLDVESVVRDILRPHMAGTRGGRVVVESPPGDLPPKYEELGRRRNEIIYNLGENFFFFQICHLNMMRVQCCQGLMIQTIQRRTQLHLHQGQEKIDRLGDETRNSSFSLFSQGQQETLP